jgi:molecular chaperone DnaJ
MIIGQRKGLAQLMRKVAFGYCLYDALGVDSGASQQEIKAKYYELAKRYHPDVAKDDPSAKKFLKIQEAYATLSDERKRKEYDNSFSSRAYTTQSGNYQYSYRTQKKYG